jgi:hypothetical protein
MVAVPSVVLVVVSVNVTVPVGKSKLPCTSALRVTVWPILLGLLSDSNVVVLAFLLTVCVIDWLALLKLVSPL